MPFFNVVYDLPLETELLSLVWVAGGLHFDCVEIELLSLRKKGMLDLREGPL